MLTYKSYLSHESYRIQNSPETLMFPTPEQPGFIPPHGNYQELLSYQKAEVVYDLTYRFCQRFLSKGDRTIDQMVQAARSGKQNIAEGSKASGTSKEMEIKLTKVVGALEDDVPATELLQPTERIGVHVTQVF